MCVDVLLCQWGYRPILELQVALRKIGTALKNNKGKKNQKGNRSILSDLFFCKWHTEGLYTQGLGSITRRNIVYDVACLLWTYNLRGTALEGLCRVVYATSTSVHGSRSEKKQTALIVPSWEATIGLCYDGRSSTMSSSVPRLPRVNLSAQDTVPLSCWNEHCRKWAIYICATLWLWTDYATAKHALHNQLCTPLPYTRCSQTERLNPSLPPRWLSEVTGRLASNQICYVPLTPNSSLPRDLYLFLLCTGVHYDTSAIQWLEEINGVQTHIKKKKQLLGGMCLFSVHRVILNDW